MLLVQTHKIIKQICTVKKPIYSIFFTNFWGNRKPEYDGLYAIGSSHQIVLIDVILNEHLISINNLFQRIIIHNNSCIFSADLTVYTT